MWPLIGPVSPAERSTDPTLTRHYAHRVPRLILLNGPPGCGKSTLAQRFVDEHPLTASLDVDRVRSMLGGWQDNLIEAGLLARAMTLAMARTLLTSDHDVVIPQYLGRVDFIHQLEQLAAHAAASFIEIVLLDSLENSVTRYMTRGGSETPAALGEMYDRLVQLLATRPDVQIIHNHEGRVDEAYGALLACLPS
jgi:predicted kinase